MNEKILVVDDEKNIVEILSFNLKKEGYTVVPAYDGQEALDLFVSENPDLVLLDVMMPKLSGYDVCRKIRETSKVPIIMVTARSEDVDTVLGLELGADDYVTKPFSIRPLMARIRTNLRRMAPSESAGTLLRCGDLVVDPERCEVVKGGKPLDLSIREVELLKFLMMTPGHIFSREELLSKVWGYEYFGDARTVDVTMRRLREKVEDNPSEPVYLITRRGLGYYFTDRKGGQ